MKRPVAVTASAIVAILGSVVALLFAAATVASLFMVKPTPQPPYATQFTIGAAAMFIAFGVAGIWTSVGVFRLRSWARASILIFAGFLAASCVVGLLVMLALPIPPEIRASTQQIFRVTAGLMVGIPLAVAIWWLIQFNTRSTTAAFELAPSGRPSPRPISITFLAWMSIIGGVFAIVAMATGIPAFLFGARYTGWVGVVIYALFAALSLYIGKGLLDLKERARIVAIGWFAFSFVHTCAVAFIPSLRQRMLESQRALDRYQQDPVGFDPGMVMNAGVAFAAVVTLVTIWFLMRNRHAFVRAENARDFPGLHEA